jgi:hypothetical protein
VRIGKSAECSSYIRPFSARSAFGTHLKFTLDQSIKEHGEVTGKHLVILSRDIARVTQHMTSQAMHVNYKRRSEIFAEYWLEIMKGDLMYKPEVVTLCTIHE